MLDVGKMKDTCRICARELCGNQRRWIFHPAAKLNLQVLLSHALGQELIRDGRGEFACSKCAFMLDRMYRFDTVIARVEALSLKRLHKLLLEKDRLRQCVGRLYWKNNTEDCNVAPSGSAFVVGIEVECECSPVMDLSALQDMRYSDMIQDDLAYSVYESWADKEDPVLDHHQCTGADSISGQKPRRCRGCAALRVTDSDYEAVCKVPRRVGHRSTSCGPSTHYSAATLGMEDLAGVCGAAEATAVTSESPSAETETEKTMCNQTRFSPASSVESLNTTVDIGSPSANHKQSEDTEPDKDAQDAPRRRDAPWGKPPSETSPSGLEMMLSLLRGWEYRPVKPQKGSKLPVLVKAKLEQGLSLPFPLRSPCGEADCNLYRHQIIPEIVMPELVEMEQQWRDEYVQCGPFHFQQQLIDEQHGQLSQYENAAGQCVGELQKAQDHVCSLQAKIRESETRNQKLQERLGEMELELRLVREEALQQERNIQNVTDTVNSKEAEVAELYRVIEEQSKMLCCLKELANCNQLQQLQGSGSETIKGQAEILALQTSLFQAQLELQASQRSQLQAARTGEDLRRAMERLEKDLQGALQHRRETERHNQELQLALENARSALHDRDEQLREGTQDRQREKEEREKTIRELKMSLQTKEQLMKDCSELLENPKEKRDSLLQKFCQRIKEKDRALEQAVDEKFRCMEEKEEETRRLQLLLREKERDVERQRCTLANNEETITSLEMLMRGKVLELEQVCDAFRNIKQQQQESEERQTRILTERDAIISQLQAALHTRTQEAQDLRCSLVAQVQSAPIIMEELKVGLQLKDRLFQEVLADRAYQAHDHQKQVQNLLRNIISRDQYIQDSATRLGEVITEQASRLQVLRKQLNSGLGSQHDSGPDLAVQLHAVQEELHLALRREKESRELSRSQAVKLDSLNRALHVKEEIIREFELQMMDPSGLPLVERLTQEVQELRESLVHQDGLARGPALGHDWPNSRQPESGELNSEDEDQADDINSKYTESIDEEKSNTKDLWHDGHGLMEVKQLVEQKRVVERELGELKAQLEKAGFSSLSQIRKALLNLQTENKNLKHQLTEWLQKSSKQIDEQMVLEGEDEDEEEELDVTIEGEEEEEWKEEETSELWEACDGELSLSQAKVQISDEQRKKTADRPESLDLFSNSSQDDGLANKELAGRQQTAASSGMWEKSVHLQQKRKELQERLIVSEATVQAQAEQLKDYRLLTETAVNQNSKQIQVDPQDLGYETCGRSENEVEREDTSSPEFDDLEMCTSLDCSSQWWPASSTTFTKTTTQSSGCGDEVLSLQCHVEDLRSQLSRSQGVIRGLQTRLCSLSISSDYGPSTPSKINLSFQASPSQTGTEEDKGWQSSDGGPLTLSLHHHADKGLQQLVSRVDALEDQLRKGGKKAVTEDVKSAIWPGKFDTLIQGQARELSHLRQRLREGRCMCNILTQHLGDTTKAFEELLRANDIDYYMGQSFRDKLAKNYALAQRASAKISARDHSEDPDEKTELLAIRLSKELQQKDKVIESLHAKLNQHHHPHRSDTPCSSHALSDTTDQSDRISYVSDEYGSTKEELELCSDMDPDSELGQEETQTSTCVSIDGHSYCGTMSSHGSIAPSITPSHRAQSCLSCPSMQCSGSPHKPTAAQSQTASASVSSTLYHPPPCFSTQKTHLPFHLHPSNLRTRYQGSGGVGFSLAEVHQELQMLQRQLGDSDRFSTPQSKPLQGFPLSHQQPDSSGFPSLSYQGFQPSPFGSAASSSSLDACLAMKAGANLLHSSALLDMAYDTRPMTAGADLSSGSSGYQSGTSITGSDLMKEHLTEIRSLRRRLEHSIQTNDRLRQQLEERLACTATEKGAPTNIYIHGLDSASQLSSEIMLLKEKNVNLENQLKQVTREADQLREAAFIEQSRLKEAQLEAERWAEQSRKLQAEAESHSREITQLKQHRLRDQESIHRLQHDMNIIWQQLCESHSLVHSLQCELHVYRRGCGVVSNTPSGQVSASDQPGHSTVTFDSKTLHIPLDQQLSEQNDTQPQARRQLLSGYLCCCTELQLSERAAPPLRNQEFCLSELTGSNRHNSVLDLEAASTLQVQAPNCSFVNSNGRHAVSHMDNFKDLQQQIFEGSALLCGIEATLFSLSTSQEFFLQQPSGTGSVTKLLSDTKTLRQILNKADSLVQMFWRAALPDSEETQQDHALREEVVSLRLKLSERDQALKDAMEKVKSSNNTKDSMEHFIVSQLSRTQDVLRRAKINLQENEHRISSFRQASFSIPPSSPSPSSSFCSSSSHTPGLVKIKTQEMSVNPPSLLAGV